MSTIKLIGATLFFFLLSFVTNGQVKLVPPPVAPIQSQPASTDTIKEFEIIRGPSMRSIRIDSVTTLQTVAGGAVIKQGTTIFTSDSVVLNPNTHVLEAFGHVHINQADTVHTYGDYLKYLGVEKMAYINNNVKLTDRNGSLVTQNLDYNLETGIGNFYNGGKVTEGKTVITSTDGTYFADTKDIYFKKNVKLDDPKNHLRADSLLYNMTTKKANFISETTIKNDDIDVKTTRGTYDLNSGNAFFTERTSVKDSSGRVYTADNIALENKTGNAQLEGNAIIVDTANNFIVIGNQIFLNKKNNSFLATRKPLLIIKQKNDSTYIAADTIFSGITTFVERDKMSLQKDTVINVNLQQDQKVANVETIDSSERKLPSKKINHSDSVHVQSQFSDSTGSHLKNRDTTLGIKEVRVPPDSSKRDSLKHSIKDSVLTILKDTSKIIETKNIDVLTHADSARNKILNLVRDSISGNGKIDSGLADSIKTSTHIRLTDSSIVKTGVVKDSTNKSDSATRYFLAFHNVRIFNDSLQSVCDSMFLSSKDSVFRLYKEPVIWSGSTQITGDTLYLFTKNKQPERLYTFENAMSVNRTREGFFNQMAGKSINGYFQDGKIDFVRVKGSQSESIYYMQNEDSAYIGMNRATGDVIDLFFKNEDLIKVTFINEIKGSMYPMGLIPQDQKQLKNFRWLDARRPKSKFELYE